jgi:hypothetical protein
MLSAIFPNLSALDHAMLQFGGSVAQGALLIAVLLVVLGRRA